MRGKNKFRICLHVLGLDWNTWHGFIKISGSRKRFVYEKTIRRQVLMDLPIDGRWP